MMNSHAERFLSVMPMLQRVNAALFQATTEQDILTALSLCGDMQTRLRLLLLDRDAQGALTDARVNACWPDDTSMSVGDELPLVNTLEALRDPICFIEAVHTRYPHLARCPSVQDAQSLVALKLYRLGEAILRERNNDREHKARHFYLLQGLIYLQKADGKLVKLTCGTPNANRERGGVAYYCIPSSNANILCHVVDGQIPAQIHRIQVEEAWLPRLREAYVADVETRLGKPNASERQLLEKALKSLDEEELASARLHARGKMSEEVWDSLWKDWQDQRNAIRQTLRAIEESCEIHIATLDDALKVIAKAGILFDKLERLQQRTLLQYMVKRVIVNPEGQILRTELRTPFNYLHSLIVDGSKTAPQAGLRGEENKTSRDNPAGSKFMSSGAPMGLSGHIRIQRTRRRAAGLSRALSPCSGSCAARL
jgi:hypothetical protein